MQYQKEATRWWLGADVPGPKSGVHGLICLGKEATACNNAVQQSRVRIWDWWLTLLFFLGRLWCQAFLRAVLRLPALRRLLRCLPVWVRVALGLCFLPAAGSAPSRRRPGRASSFFWVCSRSWSSRSSFSSSSLVGASVALGPLVLVRQGLRRFSRCFCLWAVSRHFPCCGVPARWRDLWHVVFDICRKKFSILAGSLGVFLIFAAPDPGGC